MAFNEYDKIRIYFNRSDKFIAFLDTLCLTDRQKEIAKLKYIKGWVNIDIGAEMGIARGTVNKEMKTIRSIIGKALLNSRAE